MVKQIGRPFYSDAVVQLTRYLLARATVAQNRLLFNRTASYEMVHKFPAFKGWVEYVDVDGVTGRWLANPGTKRSEDEVVFLYIHGGGFVLDTSGNAQLMLIKLAKLMNLKRNVQFSIFCLDYELSPEFKYPSQLIETLAAYHYLVNKLHIAESKICVGGDSAGGNLAAGFLLYLARPNPKIKVPASFGPTPKRPGSVLLISPFVKLVSHLPSRTSNSSFDYIDTTGAYGCALDYIGVSRPNNISYVPSWHPLHLLPAFSPSPLAPAELAPKSFEGGWGVEKEGEGMDLFESPYVNPSVCRDLAWWKEACPGEGRTMVTWGQKEIFCDDVEEFVDLLNEAGVAPTPLCKPLGAHDWIIFDAFVPGVYKTNTLHPSRNYNWGLENLQDFFQETDLINRKLVRDGTSADSKEILLDSKTNGNGRKTEGKVKRNKA